MNMKKLLALLLALSFSCAHAQQATIAGQQFAGLGAGVWGISTTANGTGYIPGDTYTPTIPGATANPILNSGYNNAILYVATTQVVSATVAAGGTSCSGVTATLTGTTGTGGSGAFFTATVPISGGAISGTVTITSGGSYRTNPTSLTAEPVTGSSCSGAQLSLVMGVQYANVQNPGSYSVIPSQAVAATQSATSGAGTGATFNLTFVPYGLLVPPTNSPNFGAQNVNQAAYNWCAGYLCLNSVTSGVENTGFGWNALNAITTGGFNTVLGVNAMGVPTIAANNVAIGRDAEKNCSGAANGNTWIGDGIAASAGCTSASNNVGLGSTSAFSAITTATGNVGIGLQVLNLLTTGNSNVAIGAHAGQKITTGSPNTILGSNVASTTLATGGNNIMDRNWHCNTCNIGIDGCRNSNRCRHCLNGTGRCCLHYRCRSADFSGFGDRLRCFVRTVQARLPSDQQ
jgi:hypothetical protein